GSPMQVDPIVFAGFADHPSTELLRVIGVDHVHHTPHGPGGDKSVLRQPGLFGKNGMGKTQTDRPRSTRIKADIEPDDDATEDIDSQREPGPTYRPAMDVIDD